MSALLVTLLCLTATFPAFATEASVVLVLQHTEAIPERVRSQMQREADTLLLPAGYSLRWQDEYDSAISVDGQLVVVDLRGPCAVPAHASAVDVVRLGSTAVSDGRVLPFAWIDCSALARVIETSTPALGRDQRQLVYGRALGRVLAHELYHILAQTMNHTESGIARARFDLTDVFEEHAELPPHLRLSVPMN